MQQKSDFIFNSPMYGNIRFDELLSLHTTMKIGGPARAWVEPETIQQLQELIKLSKNEKIPLFIIGSGSNVVADKEGLDGLCVKLNMPDFTQIKFKGTSVTVGGGVILSELLNLAANNSLTKHEFLAGIPGTVGAAIYNNTGLKEEAIGSLVKEITVIDKEGNLKKIKKDNINFSYRSSGLGQSIIVSAALKFSKGEKADIKSLLRINLMRKINNQDYSAPSAGCIFKNPEGSDISAAKFIQDCGLKGKSLGGAQISPRHANFIINNNKAKPKDVFTLMKLMKKKVKSSHGVKLEEEVNIIQ